MEGEEVYLPRHHARKRAHIHSNAPVEIGIVVPAGRELRIQGGDVGVGKCIGLLNFVDVVRNGSGQRLFFRHKTRVPVTQRLVTA